MNLALPLCSVNFTIKESFSPAAPILHNQRNIFGVLFPHLILKIDTPAKSSICYKAIMLK